jgi:hypothetical protein
MKSLAALAVLVISGITIPALADTCQFAADKNATIGDGPVRRVVLGTGAGDLVVTGEERQEDVRANGRACASSEQLLGQIRLETRREGDTVYLKTILPEPPDGLFGWTRYAYLDLTVTVPRSAVLSVEDSSGDLELRNVQSAVVADSSGDQTLRDVAGDLEVTDSSGDIDILHIAGKLTLKDSSGDIDIEDVRGEVEIEVDSSGDLAIRKVAGNVHVIDDSSGDIEISDVQRNVNIDRDTSGGIRVDRIGGDFTVRADSSGSLEYERVLGAVSVPER